MITCCAIGGPGGLDMCCAIGGCISGGGRGLTESDISFGRELSVAKLSASNLSLLREGSRDARGLSPIDA